MASFSLDSHESYGSWNNGSGVVHLVNCISLERLDAVYTIALPVRLVQVVKQWFTSCTVGGLYIVSVT